MATLLAGALANPPMPATKGGEHAEKQGHPGKTGVAR